MYKKFSWKVFAVCVVLILSLTLSAASPILYFVIGNKQDEQATTASSWFDGEGMPDNAVGSDGDYYLDTLNGNVYQKKGSVWKVIYTIGKGDQGEQGPAGEDGNAVKTGAGEPNASHVQGKNGDLYLDTETSDLYEMQDGSWVYKTNIKGLKGDDGATWQVGDKDPREPQSGVEGKEGDFYLNSSTWDLYKKTAESWALVGNIRGQIGETGEAGQDGATWIVGTQDPQGTVTGKNGDLYLNTQTWNVYKCSGGTSWSQVGNIQGIAGPKGDAGKDGTIWKFGQGSPEGVVQDAKEGDYYLDEKNFVIYRYTGSDWQNVGSIKGKDGEDGLPGAQGEDGIDGVTWTVGAQNPNGNVTGKTGDLYLDTTDWTIYKKTEGDKTWTRVGSIKGKDGVQGPAGDPGKAGATWKVGEQNPNENESGTKGDLYLNKLTWEVYECQGETTWTLLGKIKGDDGTDGLKGDKGEDGATWQVGTDDPLQGGVEGKKGDLYLNTDNWNVYQCSGGTSWEEVGCIKGNNGEKGPAGENGATWHFGNGVPQNAGIESPKTGDYYLDEDNFEIYRYEGSSWKDIGSIKGTNGETGPAGAQGDKGIDGATWTLGTGDPNGQKSGKEGDLYLDTSNWTIYKNTNGAQEWQSVGSIKGQDGVQGPAGQTGKDGATWKVGEQDPNGSVEGKTGDLYLNKKDWKVYECTEGTVWNELGSIKGNDGKEGLAGSNGQNGKDGNTWQVGTADPTKPESGVSGKVGDLYLNTEDWNVYRCTDEESNTWVSVGSILGKNGEKGPAGEKGEDGATWYFGTGDPTKQFEEAKEGDFYLDKESFDVWHYGAQGWNKEGNIKGQTGDQGATGQNGKDGITWTIGELDPTDPESAVEGNEGDMYLNSLTMTLYKCTGGNNWTPLGSIRGQDGDDGKPGQDGEAGKDADELYMGYDGYIWRGAERSDWYIQGATVGDDVFERTIEVAEVMKKYFDGGYVDLSKQLYCPYALLQKECWRNTIFKYESIGSDSLC